MKKDILEYKNKIDKLLEKENVSKKDLDNHLVKIKFYQHERLIHLIVTCFFVLFFLAFFALTFLVSVFVIIDIILFVCIIFYIFHYYYLENTIAMFYQQYDLLVEKVK